MIVTFLEGEGVARESATPAQWETYKLLKAKLAEEGRVVPIGDFLAELNLQDPRPFISRVKHLEKKGFLALSRETEDVLQSSVVVV